jgi:hypothetical protein
MSENRINSYRGEALPNWPFGINSSEYEGQLPTAQAASTQDLYAIAWGLAKRDYEMNRLFNGPFDYEI